MNCREHWRTVLDAELERWSAMSYSELVTALPDVQAYDVEFQSQTYQVEVEILDWSETHVHVMVAVDDGSLPASVVPLSASFIRNRDVPDTGR